VPGDRGGAPVAPRAAEEAEEAPAGGDAASECVTLSEDALVEAIRTGQKGSACDWFVEHVQWLGITKGRSFDALHKTISLVANGAVLGACSLVALPKGPSAIRPIAVGEVLRRIVARARCI
jgi:hypothetical protein